MAWINHPQMFKRKVLDSTMHRSAGARRVSIFKLKSKMLASHNHQQVEFSTSMGGPEVGISCFQHTDDLFLCKAFPRSAEFRVRPEVFEGTQLKKSMKNSGISNIYLGGLNLPFANIFIPRGKDSDHVGAANDSANQKIRAASFSSLFYRG